MRHRNPTSTSCCSSHPRQKCYLPYMHSHYTYKKASPERVYIQVMKFVAEHPNCKRIDIIRGLWWSQADKYHSRGTQSSLFACLLYDDLLDYNRSYEYTVTKKGYDLLRRAGISE